MSKHQSSLETLWQAGDYRALGERLRLQRAAGDDTKTTLWSALCARAQGDLHGAYRHIAPLAARSPNKANVQALLGRIADDLDIADLRLQAWQAAVNAEPTNMKYRIRLAKYHADMGNPHLGRKLIEVLQETNIKVRRSEPVRDYPRQAVELAHNAVVVLVPIYDDLATTRACLDSVLASLAHNSTPAHLLLINDASPEVALAEWLRELAAEHSGDDTSLELLEHKANRGFIHTVNAGLARYPEHDAVLLNADTLVHGNWLDRLRGAAHSERRVASVTPLTNFGELVSFPVPMRDNPLVDDAQVQRLDRLAAEVNSGETVALPTGVGFCFYLRREALDAVGLLNDADYVRGYGEEVDLSLRFAAAGYKNLCAADVYVGHRGNKSFKSEKQVLAYRNNKELFRRYRRYKPDYDAFLFRDPLGRHRARMEQRLLLDGEARYQLLRLHPDKPAAKRARFACAAAGEPLLMAYRDHGQAGTVWRLLLDDAVSVNALLFRDPRELEAVLGELREAGRITDLEAAASEPEAEPFEPAAGRDPRVIAVEKGDNPLAEYAVIERLAHYILRQQLPVLLWLQYRTPNDSALTRLGCVQAGLEWPALAKKVHWQAAGVSQLWRPDPGRDYSKPEHLEAVLHER